MVSHRRIRAAPEPIPAHGRGAHGVVRWGAAGGGRRPAARLVSVSAATTAHDLRWAGRSVVGLSVVLLPIMAAVPQASDRLHGLSLFAMSQAAALSPSRLGPVQRYVQLTPARRGRLRLGARRSGTSHPGGGGLPAATYSARRADLHLPGHSRLLFPGGSTQCDAIQPPLWRHGIAERSGRDGHSTRSGALRRVG